MAEQFDAVLQHMVIRIPRLTPVQIGPHRRLQVVRAALSHRDSAADQTVGAAGIKPDDTVRKLALTATAGGRASVRIVVDGVQRSEERRVGKERRSRWSPYHQKKSTLH